MLFWTVQTILISFILIFLVHHLISYFKQILTVPKTKDLVNSPIQKYNDMFKIIASESQNSNTIPANQNINIQDYLPKPGFTAEEIKNDVNQEMKNELKSFLKKQMTTSSSISSATTTTTDISALDSFGSSSYYSNY
jgi:hypothetical protein